VVGDDRLEKLMGRYSGSVVPASTLGAKPTKGPNQTKKGSKKPQERVWPRRTIPR